MSTVHPHDVAGAAGHGKSMGSGVHRPRVRRGSELALATLIAVVALLLPTAVAGAAVVAQAAAAAEGATRVTFTVGSCQESATVALRVRIPPNATGLVIEDPPGWTSTRASCCPHATAPLA